MYNRILRRMRELVRTSGYVMTLHAVEEMEADGLTVFDMERCILTGEIVSKQKDSETGESKYIIEGETVSGKCMVAVGKIGVTGKLVIITVYVV